MSPVLMERKSDDWRVRTTPSAACRVKSEQPRRATPIAQDFLARPVAGEVNPFRFVSTMISPIKETAHGVPGNSVYKVTVAVLLAKAALHIGPAGLLLEF